MSEWQVIETAPKDGTRILLAAVLRSGERRIGAALWEDDGWAVLRDTATGKVLHANGCTHTHWQPLPDPPEIE